MLRNKDALLNKNALTERGVGGGTTTTKEEKIKPHKDPEVGMRAEETSSSSTFPTLWHFVSQNVISRNSFSGTIIQRFQNFQKKKQPIYIQYTQPENATVVFDKSQLGSS